MTPQRKAQYPADFDSANTISPSTYGVSTEMATAEEDEDPVLPADTLQLLQQFRDEKDARTKQFEDIKTQSELDFQNGSATFSMDLFEEDWNASQFWYTDETAQILARRLLDGVKEDSAIAVVSAPSVFVQLRNIVHGDTVPIKPRICLLEYDKRFGVFGSDFIPYDFQKPLNLPPELKGKFDRIICDPPFLSEDCQTKTALTAKLLARAWLPAPNSEGIRLIVSTGERMEAIIYKLYANPGVATTTFEPQHSKGLSNEFRCYANFECSDWKWRQ